jgi:hypothetical protein
MRNKVIGELTDTWRMRIKANEKAKQKEKSHAQAG